MSRKVLPAVLLVLVAACSGPAERAPQATTPGAAPDPIYVPARRDSAERQAAWTAMPESQRQAVREAQAAFMALPADQQQALRTQFDAQDANDQHGWLLGPELGAAWPQLQPLIGTVPEDERAPLLRLLRTMPPAQLRELGRIAWRTPPAARDLVRRQLIATPESGRAAWLQAQAER